MCSAFTLTLFSKHMACIFHHLSPPLYIPPYISLLGLLLIAVSESILPRYHLQSSLTTLNRFELAAGGGGADQVKIFLRDSTSRQGKEAVNRFQVNMATSRMDSEPNYNARSRKNVQIHVIPWKCPPKFAMDCDWHVAVAGETPEVTRQIYREARVCEAIYPHPSAIPPNPSEAPDAHNGHIDDSQVPPILLTPIEEREESFRAAPPEVSMGISLNNLSTSLESRGIIISDIATHLGVDVEVAIAAAALAYTSMLKFNGSGSLIDPDLLITFLKNPELIKKHLEDQRVADALNKPPLVAPTFSWTTSVSYRRSESNEESHRVNQNAPSASLTAGACPSLRPHIPVSSFHEVPKAVTLVPGPSVPHCPTGQSLCITSSSFYCVPPQSIGPNTPSLTMTGRPLCKFFGTPRGCKNGTSCRFWHSVEKLPNAGSSLQEGQGTKRMKTTGGFGGMN